MTEEQSSSASSQADPVWVSLFIGRGMVILSSLAAFHLAWSSLYAKTQNLLADGLSIQDAITVLNYAGPALSATNDLWIMALTLFASAVALISKLRQFIHRRQHHPRSPSNAVTR